MTGYEVVTFKRLQSIREPIRAACHVRSAWRSADGFPDVSNLRTTATLPVCGGLRKFSTGLSPGPSRRWTAPLMEREGAGGAHSAILFIEVFMHIDPKKCIQCGSRVRHTLAEEDIKCDV